MTEDTMVLTVDPGTTTGYAFIASTEDAPHTYQGPPHEFLLWADMLADVWGNRLTIICERFTITTRTMKVTRDGAHDAMETIGALRYFSKRSCGKDVVFQQPADVMRLFTDDWLRDRHWYVPGMPHGNDALRHMAYHLAQMGRIKVRRTNG